MYESINQKLGKKYKTIEEKLKKLVHTQTKKTQLQKIIIIFNLRTAAFKAYCAI
jgi:hypothetical protein